MVEALMGKKALVILTNEAYLPRSNRKPTAPHRVGNNVSAPSREAGPLVNIPPASWVSPQPTICEPPTTYDSIKATLEDFARSHQPTGVNVFELGYIWMHLQKQLRMELVFATPRGGPVAPDPLSVERMEKDSQLRDRLRDERDFINKMGHTLPISWIKPEEFKLVILLGSHGAMFDLPEHDDVACVISEIYRNNGFVAAIGHGIAGLLNVRPESRPTSSTTDYFVKGRKITCPTREEEQKMGFENYLPYYLEERLKERGANLQNKKPFESNVVVDSRLITAQNAPSIQEFVEKLNEAARKN